MIADDNLVILSENVLRRMNYEEKHKYDLSKGWRDNLIAFSISSQNLINGKNVNGFVRRIVIEQDFAMILHTQKQDCCYFILLKFYVFIFLKEIFKKP